MKKQRILWMICLFIFSIWVVPGQSQAEGQPRYRALIVGRGDYGGSRDLSPGPENDAENFRRVLEATYGEEIRITEKEKEGVTTNAGLKEAIQEAFENSSEDSVNYFYYSGHGNTSGLYLGSSTMTASDLAEAFDGIAGEHILVIDCCYSGSIIEKSGRSLKEQANMFPDTFIEQFVQSLSTERKSRSDLNAGSFHIMTAASSEEQSWQGELGEQEADIGLFTSNLAFGSGVNPLKVTTQEEYRLSVIPADYDRDGKITFQEIGQFIKNQNYSSNLRRYPEQDGSVFLQVQPDQTPDVAWKKAWMTWENGERVLKLEYNAREAGKLELAAYKGMLWNLSLLFRNVLDDDFPNYASANISGAGKWEGELMAGTHILTVPIPEENQALTDGTYALMAKEEHTSYFYLLPCSIYGSLGTQLAEQAVLSVDSEFEADLERELAVTVDFGTGDEEGLVRPYLSAYVKNQQGHRVRTLAEYELTDVVEQYQEPYRYYKTFYWDGRDDKGVRVSPGTYQVEVILHNGLKQDQVLSDTVLVSVPGSLAVELQVARNPDKTVYLEGEDFDPTGMIIRLHNPNGSAQEITDYVILNGTSLTPGNTKITICKGELQAQIPIQVYACTGLEITTPPARTTYLEGENLDPSGMKVSLIFENGEKKEISDYVVEKKPFALSDTQVRIQYGVWEVRLPITVRKASDPGEGQTEVSQEDTIETQPSIAEPSFKSEGEKQEDAQVRSIKLKAGGILLSKQKVVLGRGEKVKLSAVPVPSDSNFGKITFRSTNKKVVSVKENGTIKGIKRGSAKIKVTAADGKTVTLKVIVKKAPARLLLKTGRKIRKRTKSFKIQAKLPKGTASYKITYRSSRPKVVSVNRKGIATVRKKGSAVITVTTYNKKKIRFRVRVKERSMYVYR